jgi:hypothetical protein
MKRFELVGIGLFVVLLAIQWFFIPQLQKDIPKINSGKYSRISGCVLGEAVELDFPDFWTDQKVNGFRFGTPTNTSVVGVTNSAQILARIYSYEYLPGRTITNIGTIRNAQGQVVRQVVTDKGVSYFVLFNKTHVYTEYSPLLSSDDYVFIYITGDSSLRNEVFRIIYDVQQCLNKSG